MMKPEQLRVRNVLLDTITLLCKNSLRFSQTLRIEGVIGITIDGTDLFLVHANETIGADGSSTASGVEQHDLNCEEPTAQSMLPASLSQTAPTVLCTKSPGMRSPVKVKVERDIYATASDHAGDLDIKHNRKCGGSSNKSCRSGMSMALTPATAKRNAGKLGKSFAASGVVMRDSFTSDEGIGFVGELFADTYANDSMAYDQDAYDEQYDMDESAWANEASGLPAASNQQEMLYRPMQKTSAGRARPKQMKSTRGLHAVRTRGGRRGVMAGCEAQLVAMNASSHVPRHGQSKLLHKAPRSGPQGSEFVITESTHICGYPGCSKRFRFKHDLLRHQTKVHGREPVRRVAPESALPESLSMSGSEEYGENLDYFAEYHN